MEFVEPRRSSFSGAGLLAVPTPTFLDLEDDFDDEDEDIVIGIRPKSSPLPRRKTSVDEEDSDLSEPPSLSGSRRVSFADAVGLSLVQVKEFGKWDVPQLPDFLDSMGKDVEEYFIAPFNFTPSLSSEEISLKVKDQKVELESIELLPETTILKGVVRVLNVSFNKAVYVRTSLDKWVSHFDLLSEYIPGSSDGQTDSFSFRLTLVPPFAEQGARVDFCLRYETPCGTFWSNNTNRNYVLFCHERKKIRIQEKPQKENMKKSCLKSVSSSVSGEESMSSPERENDAADVTTRQKSSNDSQESSNSPERRPEEDGNTSKVENRRNRSRRNRRKAAKMAQTRDHFAQNDSTAQDSESQPSLASPTEEKHCDSKGHIQLEDNEDVSLVKELKPTDAAILTDESEDMPNTAPAMIQDISKFPSASSEEAASDSRLSGDRVDRVDSERLVRDTFVFGTVVAPLYHQVSCGAGGQKHTGTSSSAKDQRETREKSEGKDVGLCCNGEKVVRHEQVRSMKDVEMPKDSKLEINTHDSQLMEANAIPEPDPMNSLNSDVWNSSEKIVEVEGTEDGDLSSDNKVTSSHGATQVQVFENNISHCFMDDNETVLITGAQKSPCDVENLPCQSNSFSDCNDPSLESNVDVDIVAQEENPDLQLQFNDVDPLFTGEDLPKCSFLDPPTTNLNNIQEKSLESENKTVAASSSSETTEEGNQSVLLEQIMSENVEDESTNTAGFESSIEKENPHMTTKILQNLGLPDHPSLSQALNDQTMAILSTSASETTTEKLYLEHNEDISQEHNRFAPESQIQNTDVCSDFVHEDGNLIDTMVPQTKASQLHEENVSLSLELSHDEKVTELNVDCDEKMEVLQNDALDELKLCSSLSMELSHNDDPHHVVTDHKLNINVAKSVSFTEENPIELSENNATLLGNQPTNSNDLVAHHEIQEFAKTLSMKEGEDSFANIDLNVQEIIANSDHCLEAMEERDVPTSCKTIVEEEKVSINADASNKSITVQSVGDIVEAEAEDSTYNVKEVNQMNTVDMNLPDEAVYLEMINDTMKNSINEDAMLQDSAPKVLDLERAEQLEKTKALSFEHETEFEEPQELKAKNESLFEAEMSGLCTDNKKEERDGAKSESCRASIVTSEEEFNECIASQIVGSSNGNYEEEKVKIHWQTDEEERSECTASAPMDNVQEGIEIENSRDKMEIDATDITVEIDKKDYPPCSQNTKDKSQAQESTLTEKDRKQSSDNDGNDSESESSSEDEMELYMHCLRAVYGQQSSPKTKRSETSDKDFRRPSVTRGKRLSLSLPSISESVDEEQQGVTHQTDPEKVEVQPAAPALPDFSHKEEKNDKYLWWKETFSCRNILKTLLCVSLVLVFFAVSYHYDFIACFGLYVMSVVWLYFQGERQTGKNNRVSS